jgi:hypothetical protein
MFLHGRLPTERFITHVTSKRTLPSMYKPVYLNISLMNERFLTHIAGILTLASMRKLV